MFAQFRVLFEIVAEYLGILGLCDILHTLTPVPKSESTNLWGLLSDSNFTTEKYFAQKRQDMV